MKRASFDNRAAVKPRVAPVRPAAYGHVIYRTKSAGSSTRPIKLRRRTP